MATIASGGPDKRVPAGRGREADRPQHIPARGWLDVLWRVLKRFGPDNVSLVSGGLGMYALLSVFPGLAALVSLYGLVSSPADIAKHMEMFSGVLPPGVWDIFKTELQTLAGRQTGTLGLAMVLGILVALWSARSAMSALMTATNIAYREREKRSFLKQTALSLGFTLGAIVGFVLMLTLGVALPLVLKAFGTAAWVQMALAVLRIVIMWVAVAFGLAVVYRYAPAREHAQWRWVSWGSVTAATLWLIASGLFAFYVSSFGSYGKTYGALAGVIVLLMWFYISSLIVVLGAELNAELERQTREDTTVRQGAPLGERGAFAADSVGPSKGDQAR